MHTATEWVECVCVDTLCGLCVCERKSLNYILASTTSIIISLAFSLLASYNRLCKRISFVKIDLLVSYVDGEETLAIHLVTL